MASSRQLLHVLTTADSSMAFPIAEQQQQSGAGHPVLVLSADAVHLVPPAGLDVRVLIDEPTRSPLADGSQKIDYPGLLTLIYESDLVCVW